MTSTGASRPSIIVEREKGQYALNLTFELQNFTDVQQKGGTGSGTESEGLLLCTHHKYI
jgi:hypothetical protein